MPPPTSWSPVPHIYFLTWESGGTPIPVYSSEGENSPLVISCSRCGALPFDVNLCRNRRLHEENNIIWGSLFLRSPGFFWPSSPLISKQGTIFPPSSVTFLFSQRKSTALHFHLCTQKFIFPSLYTLITYQSSYPISIFTLIKAPYCIYIIIIPDFFFYCECFCAAPHPIW